MRKPDCIKGYYSVTVATKEAAWEKIHRLLFGYCYDLDERRSLVADRPVYVSSILGEESYFTDYGDSIRIDYIESNRYYHEAFRIRVASDDREKIEVLLEENRILKREIDVLRKNQIVKVPDEPPFDPDPDGTKGNR